MAGKNGNKTGATTKANTEKGERASFIGYVNISLGNDDKIEYSNWMDTEGVFDHAFSQALERGYAFSVKFQTDTDSYTCSVSRWGLADPDAGLIYTAHSGTPYGAMQKAVWVLSVKLMGDLQNGYVKRKDVDVW